jgi:hypothetical protein
MSTNGIRLRPATVEKSAEMSQAPITVGGIPIPSDAPPFLGDLTVGGQPAADVIGYVNRVGAAVVLR